MRLDGCEATYALEMEEQSRASCRKLLRGALAVTGTYNCTHTGRSPLWPSLQQKRFELAVDGQGRPLQPSSVPHVPVYADSGPRTTSKGAKWRVLLSRQTSSAESPCLEGSAATKVAASNAMSPFTTMARVQNPAGLHVHSSHTVLGSPSAEQQAQPSTTSHAGRPRVQLTQSMTSYVNPLAECSTPASESRFSISPTADRLVERPTSGYVAGIMSSSSREAVSSAGLNGSLGVSIGSVEAPRSAIPRQASQCQQQSRADAQTSMPCSFLLLSHNNGDETQPTCHMHGAVERPDRHCRRTMKGGAKATSRMEANDGHSAPVSLTETPEAGSKALCSPAANLAGTDATCWQTREHCSSMQAIHTPRSQPSSILSSFMPEIPPIAALPRQLSRMNVQEALKELSYLQSKAHGLLATRSGQDADEQCMQPLLWTSLPQSLAGLSVSGQKDRPVKCLISTAHSSDPRDVEIWLQHLLDLQDQGRKFALPAGL